MKFPPEQEAIRAKCFHPSAILFAFPKQEAETSITQWCAIIVSMYPDRFAVNAGDCALPNAKLRAAANCILFNWHLTGSTCFYR